MFTLANEDVAEEGAPAEKAKQHRKVLVRNRFESFLPMALDQPGKIVARKWWRGALVNECLEDLLLRLRPKNSIDLIHIIKGNRLGANLQARIL